MANDKYIVDSEAGYAALDKLDRSNPGAASFTTDNGWTWTKNKDGTYSAEKDGVKQQIEAKGRYDNISSGGSSSGGGSSSSGGASSGGSAPSNNTPVYTVDTPLGYSFLDALDRGADSMYADKDGSTWTRDPNGGYLATTKDGTVMRIAVGEGRTTGAGYGPRLNPDFMNIYPQVRAAEQTAAKTTNQYINDYYKSVEDQLTQANRYATQKAVMELQNALANSDQSYKDQIQQNAINAQRASDNLTIRNTANGELGGIGGAQYSAQQAAYDAQVGEIKNQQIALYNQTAQQIALLQAQGEYELANQLNAAYQQKMAQLIALEDTVYNRYVDNLRQEKEYEYTEYQLTKADEDRMWEQAKQRLQLGVLGEDDFKILGIGEQDAKDLAQYFTELAKINLGQAQLEMQTMQAKLAGATLGSSGGSSSGGGGSSAYYSSKLQQAAGTGESTDTYSALLAMGITESGRAYEALLAAGYKSTDANRIANAYADWYKGRAADEKWNYSAALSSAGITDYNNAYSYLVNKLGYNREDAEVFAQAYLDDLEAQKEEEKSKTIQALHSYTPGNYGYISGMAIAGNAANASAADLLMQNGGMPKTELEQLPNKTTVYPYANVTQLMLARDTGEITDAEYEYWLPKMADVGDTSGKTLSNAFQKVTTPIVNLYNYLTKSSPYTDPTVMTGGNDAVKQPVLPPVQKFSKGPVSFTFDPNK